MRSFSEKQRAILWCLQRSPEGLLTPSISKITGIWKIAVYTHLGMLEKAGLVYWEHANGDTGPALWRFCPPQPKLKDLTGAPLSPEKHAAIIRDLVAEMRHE